MNFKQPTANSQQPTGFTLVEAMIAVTILTLSISGPLLAASTAIVAAETARDQLAAAYLAQEGIEYVREMRDDAFLDAHKNRDPSASADSWTDFTTGSNTWSISQCIPVDCTLDPTRSRRSSQLVPYSGNARMYLLDNGVYSQQQDLPGSKKQPFTRTIRAYTVSLNDERIVSIVSWSYHSSSYTVTVSEHLTSWQ